MTVEPNRALAALPRWWTRFGHGACVAVVATIYRIVSLLGIGRTRRAGNLSKPLLCIEGGPKGWAIIELIELAASAEEYLGAGQVYRLTVPSNDIYLRTVCKTMDTVQPTHYLYDPRTGSQHWFGALWEAFRIGLMAASRGIVPIGWLTDFSFRRWRLQVAIATAAAGVTITFMKPAQVARIFPHRRLCGPSLMPISENTLEALQAMRASHQGSPAAPRAAFIGSLYEPRTTKLIEIQNGLRARGHELEIIARKLGGPRIPNGTYWEQLAVADIVVTTADHASGPGIDEIGLPHLVYRYTEALAAGALLIAPTVPAIERYFLPGVHFIPFDKTTEAVEKIAGYLTDAKARTRIARQGQARAAHLIRARTCWTAVDSALGMESFF